MGSPYSFTLTTDSIAVINRNNGQSHTVARGTANYAPLKRAIEAEDWDAVAQNLEVRKSIETWSKGNFKFDNNRLLYKNEEIPGALGIRIRNMATKGDNVEYLLKFWERLQRNPSWRSVEQLFHFLDHEGIPIGPNGFFRAYKGVKENMTDAHSGKVDNKPGAVNEMPRNKISDDPKEACHYGYHVGALSYAQGFAAVVVICEVDPADVVCIPYDSSQQKMRVCKYRVIGLHNGDLLDNTSYELEPELGTEAEMLQVGDEKDLEPKTPELNDSEKELIEQGKRITAIRQVRARTNLGLKEAKALVDARWPQERCKNWPEGATSHICEACNPEAVAKVSEKTQAEGWPGSVQQKDNYKDAGDETNFMPIQSAQEKSKEPVEKKMKNVRDASKRTPLKVAKKWRPHCEMGMRELMDLTVPELREFATKVLSVVGASKIKGGKTELVKQIIKVRKSFKII
jgi:hypothetical protein